jgi:hyaluronate lyase
VRRRLLAGLVATALLAVAVPPSASSSSVTSADDHGRLIDNTVALFAGTEETNVVPEVQARLSTIDTDARTRLAAMDAAGEGVLFDGLPLGTSDSNLNRAYTYLYDIALATRTPGGTPSELDNDVETQQRVLDGLRWLHDHYYGDQSAGYYGNWFNWEIGISTSVTKTLVLLEDVVAEYDPTLLTDYVESMDLYLRNGENGDVDLGSRFHTGANLADITTNRILQGALLGDDARITKAIDDQLTVLATIDPYDLQHGVTDGYYADGSFIQHHSVAYTGSYGKNMLAKMVQTATIMSGTAYSGGAERLAAIETWVRDGFAPLIHEGWMMEIVKGRAVSRTTTGYTDVVSVVESVVNLAASVPDPDVADELRSYAKFVATSSPVAIDPSTFLLPRTIVGFTSMMDDDDLPAADLNPDSRTVAYNAMDKNVHIRPDYTFALARSSDRISKYEYMNNENLRPWFQADGAYYLYLSGQDQREAFGIDFYTTVDPFRLPGVTAPVEERKTVPELYGTPYYNNPDHPLGFTSSSESQNTYVYFPRGTNTYSGGATLGTFGASGMVQSDDVAFRDRDILPDDFVTYQNTRSTKSWFMLDDEVVVLAAGIDDPQDRAVTTAVDSRIADPADAVAITGSGRDGTPFAGTGADVDLSWLHYANTTQDTSIGYAFLSDKPVSVSDERVARSQRYVRASNPNTTVTKDVFGVTYAHDPAAGSDAVAYALVPGASAADMAAYDEVEVLANTADVQAIEHDGLGLKALNVFSADGGKAGGVEVDGPGSVIVQRHGAARVDLAVSDPTFDRDRVVVVVRGRSMRLADPVDGVTVRPVHGGTRIEVDTHQAHGASVELSLVWGRG